MSTGPAANDVIATLLAPLVGTMPSLLADNRVKLVRDCTTPVGMRCSIGISIGATPLSEAALAFGNVGCPPEEAVDWVMPSVGASLPSVTTLANEGRFPTKPKTVSYRDTEGRLGPSADVDRTGDEGFDGEVGSTVTKRKL